MTEPESTAVAVDNLEYSYGDHRALDGVSFKVDQGEIFGLLGPNGGGKTTLFRILSTLFEIPAGHVSIFGLDLALQVAEVRRRIGVVFQSPSLDNKLTVRENLAHHGHLYGMRSAELERQITERLKTLGVHDRRDDIVETLSGGLKRRVELAKGLLTSPGLLILDEPSTGLDPGGRRELWQHLEALRVQEGTTILVTTHLTEEAERCDHLAILDHGRIVSAGTPEALRKKIGGDVITVSSGSPQALAGLISERFGQEPVLVDNKLRIEKPDGHVFIKQLCEAFPDYIDGVSLGRPTLEDVFVHETGHRFWEQ